MDLLTRIVAYMLARGYQVDTGPGQINIVYVEGMNTDGSLNSDALDNWNDLRLVFDYHQGQPRLRHKAIATTEPGRAATFSAPAKKRGGVARIAFGQYWAWKMGLHKGQVALVQAAPIPVYRDANLDGIRTGDVLTFATGINQHSTRKGWKGPRVGTWSEGCLVGWIYNTHLTFISICKQDPRYKVDPNYLFATAILPGDKL